MDAAALGRRPDASRRTSRSRASGPMRPCGSSWSRPGCRTAARSTRDGRGRHQPGRDELAHWQTPIKGPRPVSARLRQRRRTHLLGGQRNPVGGDGVELPTKTARADSDRCRPDAGGHCRPKCVGRGERPCPETRYLLYPDPPAASITGRVGRSLPPHARRALRLPVRSRRGFQTLPTCGLTTMKSGPSAFSCSVTTARAARTAGAGERWI